MVQVYSCCSTVTIDDAKHWGTLIRFFCGSYRSVSREVCHGSSHTACELPSRRCKPKSDYNFFYKVHDSGSAIAHSTCIWMRRYQSRLSRRLWHVNFVNLLPMSNLALTTCRHLHWSLCDAVPLHRRPEVGLLLLKEASCWPASISMVHIGSCSEAAEW
jgi:hypothetical protein